MSRAAITDQVLITRLDIVGKCFPYSMCPAIKVESSIWMKKIILELHAVVAPKLVIYVCLVLVHQHASFWKKESCRYEGQ